MILLAALLAMQCPDGAPPPCARPAAAAAPTLDPHRIAILPFRVTSTDTLFGEGLAELLANLISTGELRAAHMGSVLRAWRRAGGGMRSPLDQAATQRVARDVGAARVVDGSVVGIGPRLTLSANVVTVQGGSARRVGPIAGPADSLESLIGRLASGILGTASGASIEQIRLTDSPDAMRAYLEGLAHYRRSELAPAAAAFERALSVDSGFARAAMMRYMTSTWLANAATTERWERITRSMKERLSRNDRILMTAMIGEQDAPRTPAQNLADVQRAADLLPDSPEAIYHLGDYLLHSGAANNIANAMGDARTILEQSLALDTIADLTEHLLEIAMYQGDTAATRRFLAVIERTSGDSNGLVSRALVAAQLLGDTALFARYSRRTSGMVGWHPTLWRRGLEAGLGYEELRRLGNALPAPVTRGQRNNQQRIWSHVLLETGHPGAIRDMRPQAADPIVGAYYDFVLLLAALLDGTDSSGAALIMERYSANPPSDSVGNAARQCLMGLWRVRFGEAPGHDAAFMGRHRYAACAAAIALEDSWRRRADDVGERLRTLDSLYRGALVQNVTNIPWFENRILARVYEERGNIGAALNAIRLRPYFVPAFRSTEAGDLRIEGRLAAMTGDTAGAIRAYRRYLGLRRSPEPSLIPQRDSIQSALALLQPRR